jgi:ABC-type multidrug transport system fused ATPase/permease subunit
LTKNFCIGDGDIEIGGISMKQITRESNFYSDLDLSKTVGVITAKNFYMSGTLRENLAWNSDDVNEAEIEEYVRMVKLDVDFDDYEEHRLDTLITFENNRVNN